MQKTRVPVPGAPWPYVAYGSVQVDGRVYPAQGTMPSGSTSRNTRCDGQGEWLPVTDQETLDSFSTA